jgi:gamma-glutamyltranspeptidase/glutathione hydrolase
MPRGYAVAAGHQLTAEAAAEVLRAGGTAVDACIAGALTATAAEPVLASLLGGGFLMVREAGGKRDLLDFFVQTPRRKRSEAELDFREIHADFGETTQAFHIGAGAMATPGVAAGLALAHDRYGRLPLRELAGPAIAHARDGVTVTEFQASLLNIVAPIYSASPAARAIFCDADGAMLGAGATFRNPELADVLDVYAREGLRFIHEGEVARALLALSAEGGHLTAEDLRAYRPIRRAPITHSRGGAEISLNPAPSLGGTLIAFALSLIPRGAAPADYARAFAATTRARLEAAVDEDPSNAERLLSPEMIEKYRKTLAGRPAATRGTTHISAVDRTGASAALTLSNGEGCGLIAPGTGLMPNNMLGEEDLCPAGFNLWPTDARLSSMMAPTCVTWPDGSTAMLGSGGSNRIRSALAQVLARLADGARLDDAIHAPRLHSEGAPASVDFEDRIPEGDRVALLSAFPEARGWAADSMFFGGVHAVRRAAGGAVEAAGDPRRAGVAISG